MLPLSGVRVIAVEQYGAGPFGSMLLGDLGAEVIKIENPAEGGDIGRAVGPYYFGPGDSHFFQAFNRNKRSLTLNLKHPEARGVFHESKTARTAGAPHRCAYILDSAMRALTNVPPASPAADPPVRPRPRVRPAGV